MTEPQPPWVDPNPPEPTSPRTPAILAAVGAALAAVVIATLIAVVVRNSHDDTGQPTIGEAVLIGVTSAPSDPFTESVLVVPVAISSPAAAAAAELVQQIPIRADRGVRLVSGRQPRLYGATGEMPPCDIATLANYLTRDSATATAWGLALGLTPQQIPSYLNTLTPVTLLSDTWVTAHTFKDGAARPEQAVLQAASAVLVDPVGVPRVHCASGGPLAPPANNKLSQFRFNGKKWERFTPLNVLAVKYASSEDPAPTGDFTLIDVESGQDVVRPAGGTIELGATAVPLPDPAVMNIAPKSPEAASARTTR